MTGLLVLPALEHFLYFSFSCLFWPLLGANLLSDEPLSWLLTPGINCPILYPDWSLLTITSWSLGTISSLFFVSDQSCKNFLICCRLVAIALDWTMKSLAAYLSNIFTSHCTQRRRQGRKENIFRHVVIILTQILQTWDWASWAVGRDNHALLLYVTWQSLFFLHYL